MKWIILFALLEIVVLVPIADNVGGEFLTGFELGVLGHEGESYLVVNNTGPLQATGVVLDVTIMGVSPLDDRKGCPEGIVKVSGDHLHATFDRMTPNRQCILAHAPIDANTSSGRITADGYSTIWSPASTDVFQKTMDIMATGTIWVVVVFVAWNAIMIAYVIMDLKRLVSWIILQFKLFKWWIFDRKRKKLPSAGDVAKYLREEYKHNADNDDASVVIVILCGKDTVGQIESHTGMAHGRVVHILGRLRKAGIVVDGGIALVPSLEKELKKRADDLCGCLKHRGLSLESDAD